MARRKDISGIRFNRLVAIKPLGLDKFKNVVWLCKCDCGNTKKVPTASLSNGNTQSCGCYQKDRSPYRQQIKHGMSGTRPYEIWTGIKKRCFNQNCKAYKWYGEKGITMSTEWCESFENFWNDMKEGYKDNLTLDRINTKGNYERGNCRWTTMKVQNNNRLNNRILEYKNKKYTLQQLADKTGLDFQLIHRRLKRGWTVEEAVNRKKFVNRYY